MIRVARHDRVLQSCDRSEIKEQPATLTAAIVVCVGSVAGDGGMEKLNVARRQECLPVAATRCKQRAPLGSPWPRTTCRRTGFPPNAAGEGDDIAPAIELIDAEVAPDSDFWFVYTRSFHGDPGGQLRTALLDRDCIAEYERFAGIVLYRGKWTAPVSDRRSADANDSARRQVPAGQ